MKLIREYLNEIHFERGADPKKAMGTGIETQIRKYAEEQNIDEDSYIDILQQLLTYNSDITDDTKKIFIDWLLKHIDIVYLDNDIMDALFTADWNLVPYFKKYPSPEFVVIKKNKNFILTTNEWNNFTDYFNFNQGTSYKKYIDAVLGGDAIEYFDYDYDEWHDKLDVYELEYGRPREFEDVITELKKLKFPNKQNELDKIEHAKFSSDLFNFIWQGSDNGYPGFKRLKNIICRAANDTIQAANEYAAFKELIKQISDHFDLTLIESSSTDLQFKISEKGLNKFIYAYYLDDAKTPYNSKDTYGDFDVESFHECFYDAINN